MHRVKITMGDPCNDGHGQHETIEFMCNKDGFEITKLYQLSVDLHTCDITTQCEEYEDSALSEEYLELARATLGHFPEAKEYLDEAEKNGFIDSSGFATLYLYTVKQVAPDFEFEAVTPDYNNELDIGGYGLFSS